MKRSASFVILSILLAAAASLLPVMSGTANAIPQGVALLPIPVSGDNSAALAGGALEREIAEKLKDRFDVRIVPPGKAGTGTAETRAGGAPYRIEGSAIRIGRSVSLELRLIPNEPGAPARAVVATAPDDSGAASPATDPALPGIYKRLVIEATANLKLRFFGDDRAGGKGRIAAFSGTLSRSGTFSGNPISAVLGDVDLDGKRELIVALPPDIAIYRIAGDDLVEKYRIRDAGADLVRIDAADLDRNGMAEILAVRFAGGKAISDVWSYDGKRFAKSVSAVPWHLAHAELPGEGTVLLGQESDPALLYRGPVFRIAFNRYGQGEIPDKGGELPLPDGTGIFDITVVKDGKESRFAILDRRGFPNLHDLKGKPLGAGSDPLRGPDPVVQRAFVSGTPDAPQSAPARLFPVDLNGDGVDELIGVNHLVTPGTFFESVMVHSGSEILAFAQDGGRLRLAWRSAQTGLGSLDSFLYEDESTKARRVGMIVRDKGKLLEREADWRILWMR